jgi:N-acyl-D-aspartate/D-glutamate deacylase
MATTPDLVIRGGLVADGLGGEPRAADIAICGGIITAVGAVAERGAREIDAAGLLVTPGFIDLHTHYDGQAIWSQRLNPSSSHGVTTVVMGNCGVGFAPCRPADRDLLVATMEGVEDIPEVVMAEGLTWEWETFPQFMDALEARRRDIDVAMFVPHSAVRVFVMGERGANREPATPQDLEQMAAIVREGVKAGALGFASSRASIDRRSDGALVPSFAAIAEEFIAAGNAVREAGGGLLQVIPELGPSEHSMEAEFGVLAQVADAAGLPLTFTIAQGNLLPDRWRQVMALVKDINATSKGRLHPQYFPRPIGIIASFDLTSNPFLHCPTYQALAHLPLTERIAELRKPEVRAAIIGEKPGEALMPLTALARDFDHTYALTDPPNYEPDPKTSISAIARQRGVSPEAVAYDLLLEKDGTAMLYVAAGNYADGSLELMFDFFGDPDAVMGLGDGGAHYGLICDSSYPTFVLSHWARDRQGRRISVGEAVRAMTSEPAKLAGLGDRGVIAPGYKADINVIDHAGLRLNAPAIHDDLPAGGRRLDQSARGYRWTLVAGEVISRDDAPTGALPGRLVRGARGGPAALN